MSNKRAYLNREDEGPNSSEDVRSEVRETEVESTEDSSPRPQLGNDLADRPSTSQSLPAERQQQANEEFIRKWKEALEMTAGGRSHDAPKSHDTQTQNKRPEPTKHEVYCEGLYERALLRMKEKEARSAEHQREEEEKELKDLTFSPQISSYARNLESSPGPVEERLFKADEDSKNTIRALRRVQHDNEMEECTFKPTINVYKSTSNKETLPFFGRLKAESYQRQMKAAKQLEEQKEKVMETAKGKHRKYRRKSKASRGEVYNRLWAETSSNRVQKKEKTVWNRRESIMLNGAPLSPFALNLRTPQKRVAKVKGDKPLHNEWINNLYKDASVRRKVQRSREEAIDKQILDQTTCYSMTNHSFNIIMKTVSRQTMHILDKIFPDSDCILQQRFLDLVIEFEILPPLEKLGVRYLKYLPEEELLVDRLWKILATESGKEESRKGRQVVPKVAMHDFMILVECCILNGNIKQEMRELFNEKKNTEDAEFWRVLDAVSEMKLVNKQAYSNLKSSSSSESEDTGRSSKNAKDAKKSKKSFLQFYKTQLSHPEKVKVKTDKLRAKLDAEELSHCTFTPNVNRLHKNSKPARKVVRKRMSIVEHLPLNFQNAATGGSEMMPIEKREGAGQSGTPRMKAPKQKKPPSPNRVTYSVLKYPKGYNKHLDRMSVYTQFDPHCFHYVPDKEEECMMTQIAFYMEFRFQGKFASIPVHIRDNPRKIALVIAKHLGIPKEAFTELLEIVKKKMLENGCVECYTVEEEKFPFTYSYAEQFAKKKGTETTLEMLYSVFDDSPTRSYLALAERECDNAKEESQFEPESNFHQTIADASNQSDRYAEDRHRYQSSRNISLKESKSENHPSQTAESAMAKLLLDGLSPDTKPFRVRSLQNNQRQSVGSYRNDLRAALLTEPPENTTREHLVRAMEDLWLP